MATTALSGPATATISYSGHSAHLRVDRLVYDSVTRSGNTITINNLRVEGNHYANDFNTLPFGWTSAFYAWYGIWDNGSNTYAGSAPLVRTGTITLNGGYGWWNSSPWIWFTGTKGFGNLSWTVSSGAAGSRTFKFGCAFSSTNANGNGNSMRDGSDPVATFTVSYPANTRYLNVNVNKVDAAGNRTEVSDGSVGKFDEYVPNTTKIGSQVSDQVGWDYTAGTTYKINNITEQSVNWYYTGNAEYSGTLNADTVIQLDFKATSVPTGLDAILVSRAWNSVVVKSTISGFGAPSSRSGRWIRVYVCKSTDTTFTNYYYAQTDNNTASGDKTFNSSSTKTGTPDKIIGCAPFKIGVGAHNTKQWAGLVESTVYYLPPAPMSTISLNSTTRNATNITCSIKMVGKAADNTNNITGAKVNTQYRYSTDGGTTYTSWTDAKTNHTPNDDLSVSINFPYNKAIKVQTRQVTYQDTTQATAALTLDIPAVRPIPAKPTIDFSWDDLDRELTTVVTSNGTGGASGDSSLKKIEFQMSWKSDFSSTFVSTTPTTSPYTHKISYLKPLQTLYIRARVTNNWDMSSDWVDVHPTVPRPLWGIVVDESGSVNIRDMVKVKKDGTVSTRDWIEGTDNGKKRITKV